ncbi:MAG: FkbM family methyltransferase [Planctomycetes bacterium]|nr:FkbM family methyltransferase [Planctomycetota bacterium]
MTDWAFHVLAIAGVALGVGAMTIARRSHERARRRLDRLERRNTELLHIIKALEAHRLADTLARTGREPQLSVTCRATGGEDLWLLELFNPPGKPLRTAGFYIECGGFDGKNKSVTWAFDALGWNGLLVEPLPHLAALARTNRPRATVVQAALAERGSTGTARFVHVSGDDPAYEGSSHLASRGASGEGDSVKSAPMTGASEIDVPLSWMDEALKGHDGPVDVLVLDVEGAEARVLAGLDLTRRRVRVMLIEDHSLGQTRTLDDALIPAGFKHVTWVGRNRLFIHQDETELLENAERLAQASAVRHIKA